MDTYILGSKPNASTNLVKDGDRVIFVNGSLMLRNNLDCEIESHHVISDYILFSKAELPLNVKGMLSNKKVHKVIVTASKKHKSSINEVEKVLKELKYEYDVIEYFYLRRKKSLLIDSIGYWNLFKYAAGLSPIDMLKELLSIGFYNCFRKIKPSTGFLAALLYNEPGGVKCIGIGLNNSGYFYDNKNTHVRGHLEIDSYIYNNSNIKLVDL